MDPLQGTEGALGARGCPKEVIEGVDSAADEDLDSSDKSLRKRVLKIVANRDVRSSGSHREGNEGKDMEALVTASGEEAQLAGLSQLASVPSSTDAMPGVGIQVWRIQYFLLLKIDGLVMWQWFG